MAQASASAGRLHPGGLAAPADQAGLPLWFRFAQPLHQLPVWARYALATVLVLASLVLLRAFAPAPPEFPFIAFFPAILLSSMFLAKGTGLWAVILSAVLVKVVLLPSSLLAFMENPQELVAFGLFLGVGLVAAIISETLHNAIFRVAEVNDQLRMAHTRIEGSEHEKDLLLHELTHRFRNDLANLDALLRLQARSAKDPLTRSELTLASNRVQVVGHVQRLLSRSGEMTVVDVRPFILELCEELRLSLLGGWQITLEVESMTLELPSARAVIVGLVVNELVTNAVKHAFPDGRKGTIHLGITRRGNECHVVVSDNGVGHAPQAPSGSGLGQRLIRSMAQQLDGSFEVDVTNEGRINTLRFPLEQSAAAST